MSSSASCALSLIPGRCRDAGRSSGYDIEVVLAAGDLHVEVKGTILPAPAFHLSEGQREHAELMGERWPHLRRL